VEEQFVQQQVVGLADAEQPRVEHLRAVQDVVEQLDALARIEIEFRHTQSERLGHVHVVEPLAELGLPAEHGLLLLEHLGLSVREGVPAEVLEVA